MTMKKTEVEKLLESIGIEVRDDDGNIRSPDDLTKDVNALLETCDKEDAGRLLFMLAVAKHMDEDELP